MLSQHVSHAYAAELLGESAEGLGYLLKDRVADVDEFAAAVRRVGDGGSALDPLVVSELVGRNRRNDPLERLSSREREVLELMAEGRTNFAIGRLLFISPRAVEKHVTRIFIKLGLPAAPEDHRRVLAVLRFLGLLSSVNRTCEGLSAVALRSRRASRLTAWRRRPPFPRSSCALCASLDGAVWLEPRLRELVAIRTAQIDGCGEQLVEHARAALDLGETPERLIALADRDRVEGVHAAGAGGARVRRRARRHGCGELEEARREAARYLDPVELAHLAFTCAAAAAWDRLVLAAGSKFG